MDHIFAQRMAGVPRSFIREILKVSLDPTVISFAGGLPNGAYFPVEELAAAAAKVFAQQGGGALQYSRTEGDEELRQWIAHRYLEKKGLHVDAERIVITNGSQQGLDLLGKALLDNGDGVLMEEPGYLGAIQSLSLFQPRFLPVTLNDDGLDLVLLAETLVSNKAKLLYAVPSFQNPSGVSYSDDNRAQVAALANEHRFVVVEDDPYGELRFAGREAKSFYHYLPQQTVLLGSFSKVVAPGFRLGWLVAPDWLHEKLIIAKQAADLHTSSFTQRIMATFLADNNLDHHIARITDAYGRQCRAMQEALGRHFPKCIGFTRPEGGMFLWGRLPAGMDAMELFQAAVGEKVVFVPGNPFYTGNGSTATMRFSFSCVDAETIEEGVRRLASALERFSKYFS
jgi:2-aminoadipate transaminase